MLPEIDHVAVAVPSLEKTLGFFRALGLAAEPVEEVPQDQVRIAMISFGSTRIEILESTDPEGPVGRFLQNRGPGIHHVAIGVESVSETLSLLRAAGVRLIDEAARPGSGGSLVAFVHPEGTGGPLVELCQKGGRIPVEP